MKQQIDVSIIIVTKNVGAHFSATLESVFRQKCNEQFEVIIIDSGSTDQTMQIANKYPAKIMSINPEHFRFGKTRNLGAQVASGKYLVYLGGDAIPATDEWLHAFINNFSDPTVAGVYGKQIPYENTIPMEYFFLTTRYASCRIVQEAKEGKADINTIFFSNVNSALRREFWEKNPFEDDILASEDFLWAKRALIDGYKIIYEPLASVYHSHNLKLKDLFQKFFDRGIAVSQYALDEYATHRFTTEGLIYCWKEMKFLISNGHIKWMPYAAVYDITKFLGIVLGQQERHIPLALKTRFSTYGYDWRKFSNEKKA
jgi:rhamnosyltransferase